MINKRELRYNTKDLFLNSFEISAGFIIFILVYEKDISNNNNIDIFDISNH